MDNTKEKGSYEGWNAVWSEQSKEDQLNPLYTQKQPETIYQFWQRAYANDLLNLIEGKGYQRFCELGSGRGTTSMYLAENGYTDITMVDLAEEGFKVARHSFAHYGFPQPKMVLSNVEQTDLPSNHYDCIYNIGLLEHFEDPRPTLEESFRLLKTNGLIFMPIVPDMPYSKSLLSRVLFNPISIAKKAVKQLIRRKDKSSETNILRTTHNRNYYAKICEDIGFKNVQCIPYNPYWKVNDDGPFLQNRVIPMYRWHYEKFRKNKSISLHSSAATELCYLLLASK